MDQRITARALAQKHLAAGDALGWFEALYAGATGNTGNIPWADLRPNPNVFNWLDAHPISPGKRTLNVGCGLGDDAEELARRGLAVTAFDISATAIEWCKRRFLESKVCYVAADLLHSPAAWSQAFDFVQESYTLQVLPADLRKKAMQSLASFLSPGGELFIVCRAREPDDPEGQMPWPLMQRELASLTAGAGLAQTSFEDYLDHEELTPVRRFRATYRRATGGA